MSRIITVAVMLFALNSFVFAANVRRSHSASVSFGINSKIVGGTESFRGEFPWMVNVQSLDNIFASYPCGGSLINDRCVLTLDGCLTRKKVAVYIGTHNLNDESEDDLLFITSEFFNYTDSSIEGITPGIIVLPERIDFTQFMQPIGLYDTSLQEQPTDFVGENVTLTGWGHYSDASNLYSQVLRKVETTVITNKDCEEQFPPGFPVPITNNVICTSGARGVGACTGDAGGPMNYFNESKGIWTQIGIIGFGGTDGCQLGNPTGSYRLGSPQLIDWIQSICGPLPATRPPPFY